MNEIYFSLIVTKIVTKSEPSNVAPQLEKIQRRNDKTEEGSYC